MYVLCKNVKYRFGGKPILLDSHSQTPKEPSTAPLPNSTGLSVHMEYPDTRCISTTGTSPQNQEHTIHTVC